LRYTSVTLSPEANPLRVTGLIPLKDQASPSCGKPPKRATLAAFFRALLRTRRGSLSSPRSGLLRRFYDPSACSTTAVEPRINWLLGACGWSRTNYNRLMRPANIRFFFTGKLAGDRRVELRSLRFGAATGLGPSPAKSHFRCQRAIKKPSPERRSVRTSRCIRPSRHVPPNDHGGSPLGPSGYGCVFESRVHENHSTPVLNSMQAQNHKKFVKGYFLLPSYNHLPSPTNAKPLYPCILEKQA
jgi:hypothetical protein